jgi:hypothetical protein
MMSIKKLASGIIQTSIHLFDWGVIQPADWGELVLAGIALIWLVKTMEASEYGQGDIGPNIKTKEKLDTLDYNVSSSRGC